MLLVFKFDTITRSMCRFDKICFFFVVVVAISWQFYSTSARQMSVDRLAWNSSIACIWSSTRCLAADSKNFNSFVSFGETFFFHSLWWKRKKKSEKLKANDSENSVVLDERNNCVRSTIYCLIWYWFKWCDGKQITHCSMYVVSNRTGSSRICFTLRHSSFSFFFLLVGIYRCCAHIVCPECTKDSGDGVWIVMWWQL